MAAIFVKELLKDQICHIWIKKIMLKYIINISFIVIKYARSSATVLAVHESLQFNLPRHMRAMILLQHFSDKKNMIW